MERLAYSCESCGVKSRKSVQQFMTNLLAAVTLSFLVTNSEIKWPTHLEAQPCPSGMIGCTVFHGRSVAETNGMWRTNVITTRRLEVLEIPELGIRKTNKSEWVSEVQMVQRRMEIWWSDDVIVPKQSSDPADWSLALVATNWGSSYFTNTAVYWEVVTNGVATSRSFKLQNIKSISTNDGDLVIELKE